MGEKEFLKKTDLHISLSESLLRKKELEKQNVNHPFKGEIHLEANLISPYSLTARVLIYF